MAIDNLQTVNLQVDIEQVGIGKLNSNVPLVSDHDHTTGKGTAITPAAISINDNLDFNSQGISELGFATLINAVGTKSNLSVFTDGTDLIFQDVNGNVIKITSNGSVDTSASGNISGITGSAGVSFAGNTFRFTDAAGTGRANIEFASALLTANGNVITITGSPTSARTINLPDADDTLVGVTATQILSNKTLSIPTISAPVITNPTVSTGVFNTPVINNPNVRDTATVVAPPTVTTEFTSVGAMTSAFTAAGGALSLSNNEFTFINSTAAGTVSRAATVAANSGDMLVDFNFTTISGPSFGSTASVEILLDGVQVASVTLSSFATGTASPTALIPDSTVSQVITYRLNLSGMGSSVTFNPWINLNIPPAVVDIGNTLNTLTIDRNTIFNFTNLTAGENTKFRITNAGTGLFLTNELRCINTPLIDFPSNGIFNINNANSTDNIIEIEVRYDGTSLILLNELPTGGNNNNVLVKTGSGDYDIGFSSQNLLPTTNQAPGGYLSASSATTETWRSNDSVEANIPGSQPLRFAASYEISDYNHFIGGLTASVTVTLQADFISTSRSEYTFVYHNTSSGAFTATIPVEVRSTNAGSFTAINRGGLGGSSIAVAQNEIAVIKIYTVGSLRFFTAEIM